MILGADFKTTSVLETPHLIKAWADSLNEKLNHQDLKSISRLIAKKHIDFERIHPFNDDNGRIGRLLINYSLLEKDYPPFIVEKEERHEYMGSLNDLSGENLAKMIVESCLKNINEL